MVTVARKGGGRDRGGPRLMFVSPEQLSEMTGRSLGELRAESEALARAQAEERVQRCQTLILRPTEGADLPIEFAGLGFPLDGRAEAEDLARLGASSQLIQRLRSWQQGWQGRVEAGAHPREFTAGQALSVRLARQLQAELPRHEVYLDVGGNLRAPSDLSP